MDPMAQVHQFQGCGNASRTIPTIHAGVNQGVFQVLINRGVFQQIAALEDKTDPFAAEFRLGVTVQAQDVFAPQDIGAPGGTDEDPQDEEQGGLAGTGGSHNRYDFAGIDFQIDVFEYLDGAGFSLIALGEIGDVDQGPVGPSGRREIIHNEWP